MQGVSSLDTTEEARRVQLDAYRTMGADRRVELAMDMSEEVRLITLEGLRERNPEVEERGLAMLLIELWHGTDTGSLVRRSSTDDGS